MTAIEVAANIATAISIALAARNSIHTWWIGIVGCFAFGWVFFEAKLYADMTLQGFFVVTSLAGWWRWSQIDHLAQPRISKTSRPQQALILVFAVTSALLYGIALQRFTDAAAPLPDAAVLAFSVAAQLLLMARRIETWPMWLVVNTIAVPLFASRSLWLTAGLYVFFWCNAWYGWWRWRREWQAHEG